MGTVFIPLQEPLSRHPRPGRRWALWELGFRPFYLLAALQACLSVPLWALQFSGWLPWAYLQGAAWHAHEMVFGFALAVIVGFLFTAGRNWSGQPTPRGPALMALAALWLAARVAVLSPWGEWAAALNVAFPWLSAWALWRSLRRGSNRRNDFFPLLLALLGLAAAALHAVWLGWLDPGRWRPAAGPTGLPLLLALDVILFVIALMAGRVVPMFSQNGVPGLTARRVPALERASLGILLILPCLSWWPVDGTLRSAAYALAASLHLARWWGWQPWKTLVNPLVAVLHAAYAWLPVHLLLRAGAEAGHWPMSAAIHALTVGLLGLITLGMMTRTAMGHTGRPLHAGPAERSAYACMLAAGGVRVLPPLLEPAWLQPASLLSAGLWALAYVIFLWRYVPWLLRPRVDGLPG